LDALFDPSPAYSLVYVGAVQASGGTNPDYLCAIAASSSNTPARLYGIVCDNGVNSGNIAAVASGTGFKYASSGVGKGANRRCIIATKGAAANTVTCQVPSQAVNAGGTVNTGGAIASATNAFAIGSYGTSAGINAAGYSLGQFCAAFGYLGQVDSTQAAAALAWAVAYHAAVAA
jgi:hypothetical protein